MLNQNTQKSLKSWLSKDYFERTLLVLLLKTLFRFKWVLLLALLVWVSAAMTVWHAHQIRKYTELKETLHNEQYQLEEQWSKLRLEQASLIEHGKILMLAQEKLGMKLVSREDEIIIETR